MMRVTFEHPAGGMATYYLPSPLVDRPTWFPGEEETEDVRDMKNEAQRPRGPRRKRLV